MELTKMHTTSEPHNPATRNFSLLSIILLEQFSLPSASEEGDSVFFISFFLWSFEITCSFFFRYCINAEAVCLLSQANFSKRLSTNLKQ